MQGTDIFDSMFGVSRAIEIFPTYNGGKHHSKNRNYLINNLFKIVWFMLFLLRSID